MLTGIDHVVVVIQELERAMVAYRGLGFTVVPGGRHATGTHNALVGFADGTYLELLAFREPGQAIDGGPRSCAGAAWWISARPPMISRATASRRALCFVTGVPGSGKTLAGLRRGARSDDAP
jgi:hypothetical protein